MPANIQTVLAAVRTCRSGFEIAKLDGLIWRNSQASAYASVDVNLKPLVALLSQAVASDKVSSDLICEFAGPVTMGCPDLTPLRSALSAAHRMCRPLAVLIVWLVAGLNSSVQAESCGHYLFRNGQPVGASQGVTAHRMDSEQTMHELLPSMESPWIPAPCNGHGCRRNSIPLSSPPVAPVMSAASEFAAIIQKLTVNEVPAGMHPLPVSEDGHFYLSQPVFRPPICAG